MKTDHIIYLIGRIREKANRFIINELEINNIKDLAPSHGDILVRLFQKNELPMKDIAEMIDRKKNTVTVLIEKLIKLKYVEVKYNAKDHRLKLIALTEKGRKLKSNFEAISIKLLAAVYKGIPKKEKEAIINRLTIINKNLGG